MEIGPEVALPGTVATSEVSSLTVKLVASVPLKSTDCTSENPTPVTVTRSPTRPLVGLMLSKATAAATIKFVALAAVPAAVVTVMGPVVAPVGTVVSRVVVDAAVATALTPLNATRFLAGSGSKFCPVIETRVPSGPCCGVKTVITGAPTVVKVLVKAVSGFPDVSVMVGNVATAAGAKALIDLEVDAIKVGIGPGSICTTRVVTGAGMPQVTAILDCCRVATEAGVPVVADGGIKFSGDVPKALAAGAHSVMIGSLFAGSEESPGETILYQGRTYKAYRGMGSLSAMSRGAAERYFQDQGENLSKLVPEGIEGMVPFKGSVHQMLTQITGGLRSGMGLAGCATIDSLRTEARLIRVTSAGLKESHAHDVVITKEAPNYWVER